MTGNPLSGHTKANMTLTTHTSVSTPTAEDGLFDGEHIISPTLTNAFEGIHGNGILLEEDTAKADGDRNNPLNLAGRVNGVGSTSLFRVNVQGGYAVLDGVMYTFGSSTNIDIDLISTSAHKAGSPSALTSGQEAIVVIYVNSDNANNSIGWEMGSPVTVGASYPLAPSAFLNFPSSSLAVKQSVVLATLRCVFSSGSGDLNIKVTEINDKRVFIRPSPIYFSPVTSGAVAATNAIDSHTDLDNLHGGSEAGSMSGSRFGAMWQSYDSEGNQVLFYTGKDSGGNRFTRRVFDSVLSSTATSITVTSADENYLILTPGGTCTVSPSGNFPDGYLITIKNLHGSNTVNFNSAGAFGQTVKQYVYDKTNTSWNEVEVLGTGTVTSIATTAPITGGTITTSGTIGISAATTSAAGSMSSADKTKLDGIEASADVTDATNVTAAGALMDSELTDLAGVKGVTISTLQVKPSEGAFANGDKTKLDGIEASADVTDATNVTAAGALMDSEVTNLAQVKAFDSADYATAAQGTKADTAHGWGNHASAGYSTATGVENNADVTDATNVDAAGAIMHSDLGTKGDLVVGDGAGDATILGVGTNNHVLTADSSEASGVKWAATAAAGITALTGNVTASGSGSVAATIADEAVTYAKMQHVSATSRVLGRITSGAGDVEELTGANIRTIANVADGATEYTDAMAQAANAPAITGNTLLANGNVTAIAGITVKASKCFVYLSGNQSYSSGPIKVTHDTALWNVGSDYDLTAEYYVAPRDGYYLVACSFYLTSPPSWAMSLIYVDENAGAGFAVRLRRHSVNGQDTHLSAVIKLNAGDKVAHYAQTSNSGNIGAALNSLTYFQVTEML